MSSRSERSRHSRQKSEEKSQPTKPEAKISVTVAVLLGLVIIAIGGGIALYISSLGAEGASVKATLEAFQTNAAQNSSLETMDVQKRAEEEARALASEMTLQPLRLTAQALGSQVPAQGGESVPQEALPAVTDQGAVPAVGAPPVGAVPPPENVPAVLNISATINAPNLSGGICKPINSDPKSQVQATFSGSITSNMAGDVKYQWEMSGGPPDTDKISNPKTVSFSAAGTQTVGPSDAFILLPCGTYTMTLHVLSPMEVKATKNFTLTGLTISALINAPNLSGGVCKPINSDPKSQVQATVSGSITSNVPGDVKYQWEMSGGPADTDKISNPKTVSFNTAGTQTVGPSDAFILLPCGTYTITLHVLSPMDIKVKIQFTLQ